MPPGESGDGILTVVAEKGTSLSVDGLRVGWAPREIRISAGSYRVRAAHPEYGVVEVVQRVVAGERLRWEVAFHE